MFRDLAREFVIDGVYAFPTLMKEVCNAVEKKLHNLFSPKLPVGQRLWVLDGQGGVGTTRTTLNKMFDKCNLPSKKECKTEEDKASWDSEKAKWEAKTNFEFMLGIVYRKDGLPENVKLQYDEATRMRIKKSKKRGREGDGEGDEEGGGS